MLRLNTIRLVAVSAIVFAAAAAPLAAGPIDPPAGPVAGSYRTLSDVEPRIPISAASTPGDSNSLFKITQPGSYYLTGNIAVPNSKVAIEIDASNVTIDLNGFGLIGAGAGTGGISFVDQAGVYACTTVKNGSVRGMTFYGVNLFSTFARGTIVENITATGNGSGGIVTSGASVLRNCVASANGGDGLATSGAQNCVVENCVAHDNGAAGIFVSGSGTALRGCSSTGNDGAGIVAGGRSVVLGCSACLNGGDGIVAALGSTVSGCVTSGNGGDGVEAGSGCLVAGNSCVSDGAGAAGGAGIHATGADNRIEGNNCTGADRGIDVDAPGNIIVRNTCSGNGVNWDIAANNVHGPIIDRSAAVSVAVSGNAAASSLGTTDANANFTY